MHQGAGHRQESPAQALERERRLFLDVERGASSHAVALWQAAEPVVVIGQSNAIAEHVDEPACAADGIPVLRRFSGGGSVVLAPGCLNYAVALSFDVRPDLIDVAWSFAAILRDIARGLGVESVSLGGGTDLVMNGRKVSGNAQRRGRRGLLHHGTLLYDFDATLAARYLTEPTRRPAYRGTRRHTEFLGNLPLAGDVVRARLETALHRLASTRDFRVRP